MTESAGWDVASGAGFTALAAAACRAIETGREPALIRDPYGAAFVRAAQMARGWSVAALASTEVAEGYGRPLPASLPEGMLTAWFITATRS
jgi:O-methyltransferase involved in polyketide biosynthesis